MFRQSLRWTNRVGALALPFATTMLPVCRELLAQAPPPKVFYACYVKGSGVVYRIKEPNLSPVCSTGHVQFSWTDGDASGATAHSALTGLTNDDHPQYLLADGVRATTNGLAVTGTINTGAIPASGPGIRMMWYPGKAAFRVGDAGPAISPTWEDADVGSYSIATGSRNKASGDYSTAMGFLTVASGFQSTAMGVFTTASGNKSTVMGTNASTNGKAGAFVYGDASAALLDAQVDNEFAVRASGGFRFRTASDLSTGCDLPTGSGVFTCTSSRLAKEHFTALDPEGVLGTIARLTIQSWNYKAEGPRARHVGPTAEDFYAAFRLGTDSTAIGAIDQAGISMIAIQALEARTAGLKRENEALRAALTRLEELVRRLGGSR